MGLKNTSEQEESDWEEKHLRRIQGSAVLRLFSLMGSHPRTFVLGVLMVLLGTLATLLEPRIFGWAIDEAIIPRKLDALRLFGGFYFLMVMIRVVATLQQGYYFEYLGQRVTQDLRMMVFSHLQRMPVSSFDQNPSGKLLTRVTNDISSINEMFTSGFITILSNILLAIGIFGWLIALNLKLGLISLSVFPVLIAASCYFSVKLKIAYHDVRSKLSALNSFLAENFSGMKIVQLFNRQNIHLKRFERLNQKYTDAQCGSIQVFALFQPSITLAAGIAIALVIWFGGMEVREGDLKVGVLVAYFSYVLALFHPIREIADKWNIFLSGMASVERLFSVLEWPTELNEEAIKQPIGPLMTLKGEIIFENVWFAYQDERWVLKDFSLKILAGEKVGVVGHTGAGKTTLIGLLNRFYDPQRGRILLDGVDIRDYDKRALRSSIGIVQQDVFLFSGSFRENVTFWSTVSDQKMEELLSMTGLHRKKDDVLQERGNNFSMGERQVIAFARAVIKEPKIWILDEATSNMDSETEEKLQKALERVSSDSTSLFIAHRLATVKNSDRIIVLNQGSLIETGSHSELMAQNGLYARLYRYQQTQEGPERVDRSLNSAD